ncbi:hypothetical protein CRUP_020244 [Coryphaenoides rupestris]|nr:hypothetical protein CRUP_020244 [Coryphaenoides rupestris]
MLTISKSRSMSASCATSVTSNHFYSKPLARTGFPPSTVSPLGVSCPSPPTQGTPLSSPTVKTCPVELPEPAKPLPECTPGPAAPRSHHRLLTHSQKERAVASSDYDSTYDSTYETNHSDSSDFAQNDEEGEGGGKKPPEAREGSGPGYQAEVMGHNQALIPASPE